MKRPSLIRSASIAFVTCMVLVFACLAPVGCSSAEVDRYIADTKAAIPEMKAVVQKTADEVRLVKDGIAKTQVEIEATRAEIAKAKEAGQDTSKAEALVAGMVKSVEKASAVVKQTEDGLAKATEAITTLEKVVSSATDTAGLIEEGGKAAAQYVPGGYGPLVVLAATTVASLVRASQNRTAARNIAAAIEQVKSDGKVDFAAPDTASKLSAAMGSTAKRIVDEAQGDALRLPV